MEPRKIETPMESRDEAQTSPPRQSEQKRRFRIVKLEERIAPGGGHGKGSNLYTCGCGAHGLSNGRNCSA